MKGLYIKNTPGTLEPKYRIRLHNGEYVVVQRADNMVAPSTKVTPYVFLPPAHPTYDAALARVRSLNKADK